ncbi:MAG: ABC transporter ATP-binding protein [Planctomycetota bacterium]|nr:ABC transporter ATP-binding protein [Planctomycetota bacterium]
MAHSIQIDNVSKMYRLGQIGTGTVSHDLNRWWCRMRGRPDPYQCIGKDNVREKPGGDYVWALRDVSLGIEQGEIIGIIGRNGAGKSTLLKLLSRVTAPTTGTIRAKGRIASLLEVGTGFHPELTGRENIFLNGAILGMTRSEIRRQFEAIVEFSGCSKYIDTPVKRYSSGMHVRLAFAVAAHLESEILVVDEVLAVGDADFQSKCIGKMRDVSQQSGRTILFVSHNMGAVKKLCPQSVLIQHGQLQEHGDTGDVINTYLLGDSNSNRRRSWGTSNPAECEEITLHEVSVCDQNGSYESMIATDTPLQVHIRYSLKKPIHQLRVSLLLMTSDGTAVISTSDMMADITNDPRPVGEYTSTCSIPPHLLNRIQYVIRIDFEIPGETSLLSGHHIAFDVSELTINQLGRTRSTPPGTVHPVLDWSVKAA